jgi:subtilisin family serine protease
MVRFLSEARVLRCVMRAAPVALALLLVFELSSPDAWAASTGPTRYPPKKYPSSPLRYPPNPGSDGYTHHPPRSGGDRNRPPRVIIRVPPATIAQGRPLPFNTPATTRQTRRVPAAAGATNQIRPREVLVIFRTGGDAAQEERFGISQRIDRQEAFESALLGVRVVRYQIRDRRPLAQVLARLAADARVLAVQPSYVFRLSQGVTAMAGKVPQYAHEKLSVEQAHALALGRNVRVAVVDTGIDRSHPELEAAVVAAYDAIGESRSIAEGHGTAIAGVLAGRRLLKGMAPESNILAIRAFAASRTGTPESNTLVLVKAIEWAFANGARLFNMSFAGPKDPLLEKLIEAAENRGGIFVAAAGNGGPSAPPAYPAAYSSVIAVTATDSSDRLYALANRGAYITIAAPGVDILAPALKGSYALITGTSIAAAHVSGIVALLLERHPELTAVQVRAILCGSARNLGAREDTKDFGAGLADALKAVKALP